MNQKNSIEISVNDHDINVFIFLCDIAQLGVNLF